MARILRGDVRWAALNPTIGHEQRGTRPVLILSRDEFNDRSETVIAVTITSRPQRAGFPLTLRLDRETLPRDSWIKIGQIRTLPVDRIGDRIATIGKPVLDQVVEGLNELIAPS